jgi:hypothetical protein
MSDLLFWLPVGFAIALTAATVGLMGGLEAVFGCSHHEWVGEPGRAWVILCRCQKRMGHDGPHSYPNGWQP